MAIRESAALAGFGGVASPVISKLVNDSISYLGSDIVNLAQDFETTLLPQIQRTIQSVQHSPHMAPFVNWLARLKNAYFDAEAILHELEYERLKRKVEGEDNKLLVRLSSKPIIKPLAKFTGRVVKKASMLSPQKRKLLKRLNKLKEVAAEAKIFRDLLGIQNTGSTDGIIAGNHHSLTSSILTNKVFGRDRDCDEIIRFLFDEQGGSSSTKSYSVVTITGMGGAGKTTLAQYVYNDERVRCHFRVRIWFCLSKKLDIIQCTKEMIECVSGCECPNLSNLSNLQEMLINELHGNIMVVLDDVWYDTEAGVNQWDDLLKPFASGQGTCKILVTSRSTSFPIELQPAKLIQLSDLAPGDFKSLLKYYAFDGLQITNPQLKNEMSDIVDQIAEKMSKTPLAARVVGNQLRGRPDIPFWRATRGNVNLIDNMEILLGSFHRLDVQLQRCFLFCGIFPKGTRFGLDSLVPYWVALDFIQSSNDNRNVEDIGLEYFEIMVANSIFHLVDKTYIMHDLFHDLAEKLSAGDCFRITNVEREMPLTVQHVFLKVNNENLKEKLFSICNLSNLRTLILGNQFINDISEIIPIISTNFRNLRILDVWSKCYTRLLPRVIGDLRNLRLLNFWKSSIEELPDSVLQLYHLQFLLLPSSVKTLPTKMSNVIKLRCIEMYNSDGGQVNTLPPVPYLGKLTSLQHLNEFHVRKEEGYELQQLGCLKEIGGSLKIVNLENVRDKDEALKARLTDKSKLIRLHLVWSESVEINGLEIDVIDDLQPPANLEVLIIDGYRGSTYPTWLQKGSFRDNIKCVKFYNCNALTILSPNFHQFHHCSKLVLKNLGALRELSTLPESLAELSIVKCPCLIFIRENELPVVENELQVDENQSIMCENELQDILNHELKSFEQTGSKENCAEQLQIMKSIAWDNAPENSVNVTRAWWHCHQQRMNFIFSLPPERARANKFKIPSMLRILVLGYCCVSDGTLSDCLRGMTTLEELYLEGIMTITTLPSAQVLESLWSLRVVEIKHCWYLRSLGGLHAFPHLERFLVQGCWCWAMESGNTPLPPIISDCAVPQGIFNGDLPCLQNVEIVNCFDACPGLSSIRGLEPRPFINTLQLIHLPNLDVVSILESFQGCRQLFISSSVILNKLLSSQYFVPPHHLGIKFCEEKSISFEISDNLQFIKILEFSECKTEDLPKTLIDFSTLEVIIFKNCPKILGLPELPSSVQYIGIKGGCPVLRERCRPTGLDWHKIQCIQRREIE